MRKVVSANRKPDAHTNKNAVGRKLSMLLRKIALITETKQFLMLKEKKSC